MFDDGGNLSWWHSLNNNANCWSRDKELYEFIVYLHNRW